jgi:hypothetical protein
VSLLQSRFCPVFRLKNLFLVRDARVLRVGEYLDFNGFEPKLHLMYESSASDVRVFWFKTASDVRASVYIAVIFWLLLRHGLLRVGGAQIFNGFEPKLHLMYESSASDVRVNPQEGPMLQKERHPNLDFFVADLTTWTLKDDQASMEHPFFSLSKNPDTTLHHYEHSCRAVAGSVTGGPVRGR